MLTMCLGVTSSVCSFLQTATFSSKTKNCRTDSRGTTSRERETTVAWVMDDPEGSAFSCSFFSLRIIVFRVAHLSDRKEVLVCLWSHYFTVRKQRTGIPLSLNDRCTTKTEGNRKKLLGRVVVRCRENVFFKSLLNRARERKRGESRIHHCLIRFESPGRFHRCDALLVFLELLPQVRHVLHLRLADLQIKSIGFKCQVILEDMFDEFKIFNNFFIRLEFRNSS